MTLRDYQIECVESVEAGYGEHRAQLVVLPTGTGKTTVACELIRRMVQSGTRVMVLVHTTELIDQWAASILRWTGIKVGIEQAVEHAGGERVVVAMVNSLVARRGKGRRRDRFDPSEFGLVVADEAHRSLAPRLWKATIDHFLKGGTAVVGLTATPKRGDGEALGKMYGGVAFQMGIDEAMVGGWLVPPKLKAIKVGELDLSTVKVVGGELDHSETDRRLRQDSVLHRMVSPLSEILGGRRAVAFCQSRDHSKAVVDVAKGYGIEAEWIDGELPMRERKDRIASFAAGRIQLLCNCMVLLEGWDDPGVQVAVMARPIRSWGTYVQAVGRILRPLPGVVDGLSGPIERKSAIAGSAKPFATVIDYSGNVGTHRLAMATDILGGSAEKEDRQSSVVRRKAVMAAAEKAKDGIEIEDAIAAGDRAVEEHRRRRDEARITVRAYYHETEIEPFDTLGVKAPKPQMGQWKQPPSENMRRVLKSAGLNPDQFDRKQAGVLCGEIIRRYKGNLATLGQARILRHLGLDPNMDRERARLVIDSASKEGRVDWASLRKTGDPPKPVSRGPGSAVAVDLLG